MSQRSRLQWSRWEGVYSADFALDAVRRQSLRVAETFAAKQWGCLVAHDTRFMGAQFARYAYLLLEQSAAKVSFCPMPVSVPMIELALERRRFESALVVTAGNRPHWFNGLHALAPLAEMFDAGSDTASEQATPIFPPEPLPANEQTQIDVRTPYIEALRELVNIDLVRRATLTLFVDPMNGTTSGLIPAILGEGAQTRAVEINREADPLFNRQAPQPSEATLARLRKLVKESDSHLGVAISADGRALGLCDNTGEIASPIEIALLIAQHLGRQHRLRGLVVVPQQALPPGLANWETATGLKIEFAADPSARIAELVAQDRAGLLVGITAAGEPTIGRFSGSTDATLAALVLFELIAVTGSKLRTQIDELRGKLG